MMKYVRTGLALALAALALSGCANYRWTSRVPEEMRTVAVPVFENRTMSAELGVIVSQYVSREFQREGTFSLRRAGASSIEVQGSVVKAERHPVSFDRAYGSRADEYRYLVTVEVSIVNKDVGRVLQAGRPYTGETTFLVQGDLLTAQRNAAQRIAQDLARQIVDDVVSYPYDSAEKPEKK